MWVTTSRIWRRSVWSSWRRSSFHSQNKRKSQNLVFKIICSSRTLFRSRCVRKSVPLERCLSFKVRPKYPQSLSGEKAQSCSGCTVSHVQVSRGSSPAQQLGTPTPEPAVRKRMDRSVSGAGAPQNIRRKLWTNYIKRLLLFFNCFFRSFNACNKREEISISGRLSCAPWITSPPFQPLSSIYPCVTRVL